MISAMPGQLLPGEFVQPAEVAIDLAQPLPYIVEMRHTDLPEYVALGRLTFRLTSFQPHAKPVPDILEPRFHVDHPGKNAPTRREQWALFVNLDTEQRLILPYVDATGRGGVRVIPQPNPDQPSLNLSNADGVVPTDAVRYVEAQPYQSVRQLGGIVMALGRVLHTGCNGDFNGAMARYDAVIDTAA